MTQAPDLSFAEQASITHSLARAQRELLDLSARNRLLHVPRDRARSGRIDIVNERSENVFGILVRDSRSMSFLASEPKTLPDCEDPDAGYTDDCLQTALPGDSLEKRLLRTYYDARTFEEEQGANILFLALGFLRWYEQDQSEIARHAPLLLVPVRLERKKAGGKYTLAYDGAELSPNLSLAEKLREFGIAFPGLPDGDELSPTEYFANIRAAIAGRANWELDEDGIVLWFFSFAKFLMFRDLDVRSWPQGSLAEKTTIQALLRDGFRAEPPIISDDANLDSAFLPRDLSHIVDADSSQTIAIEEVKRGRSLVIQGPPGTGKSQTITNIIAGAVRDGKRVLFMAEKTAALQVVRQRLEQAGLGPVCLELHSHKSNKLAVLEELRRTLELGPPAASNIAENAEALRLERDRLNAHVAAMHTPLGAARVTPFEAIGHMVRLNSLGFQPFVVELGEAEAWTRSDVERRRSALQELATALEYVGAPGDHPCRGVRLAGVLPTDRNRIVDRVRNVVEQLDALQAEAKEIANLVELRPPQTFAQTNDLASRLRILGQAPFGDLRSLSDAIWDGSISHVAVVVEAGRRLASLVPSLIANFTDTAWTSDVAKIRTDLAAHGRSLFRFFSGSYRRAKSTLRGLSKPRAPISLAECLVLLDNLSAAQQARAVLANAAAYGAPHAFGHLWQGEMSNWDHLAGVLAWVELAQSADPSGGLRRTAARLGWTRTLTERASAFEGRVSRVRAHLREIFESVNLDLSVAFAVDDLDHAELAQMRDRLAQWAHAPVILDRWSAYLGLLSNLPLLGLEALVPLVADARLPPETLVLQLEGAFFEHVLRRAYQQFPILSAFEGGAHAQVIERFRVLDRERLRLARVEVCQAHARGMPVHKGDAGEMGTLRKEMSKKRRHLPLRQLLLQAGRSIQAIKPVFMMSPISVAQFLQPGAVEFDLLLIDEASQVQPVDALGAIARAKQIVVVGDEKQLPPSTFFQRLGDPDVDPDSEDSIGDLQSILALCTAQGVPSRMLRWHYRSRHHSLIAVSNKEFYDGRLFIPPSPDHATDASGLRFNHVADGCFDRGNTATNRREAQVLAQRVLRHARETPEASLGVGTFSVSQRDAIVDELERLRKTSPELEVFCSSRGQDDFFVKNLENIQGDERDVIFISVGYGKDSSGYMAMSFGPLNNDGGERRLNVLITRARQRCEVFSSITADDIDLQRAKGRGVAALKQFLQYAATGVSDIAQTTGRGFDSPFEEQVAAMVQRLGYVVDAQVGVAGFFIDLAVRNPDAPGSYLLGIECDGAQYHSARCARDRDRLRQQVLEDRGWQITRIWSTDWFRDPDGQARKLARALAGARSKPRARPQVAPVSEPRLHVAREAQPVPARLEPVAAKYVEAKFPVPSIPVQDLPVERLAGVVLQILKIEAPIHREEIARRVTSLWSLSRTGSRIASAVDDALRWLASRKTVTCDAEFYYLPSQVVTVRDREGSDSPGLKKAEYLPPGEVQAALVQSVRANEGIEEARLVAEALGLLGFKATGAQVRQTTERQLAQLVRTNALESREGRIYSRISA
jgi:very-short-patch-repair endonuclease